MKQRNYIDTSVVGGYLDEQFKEDTVKLFERLENNEINFVVSDLLDLELLNAPAQIRELLLNYPADKFERIELTQEAITLADLHQGKRDRKSTRLNSSHVSE